MKNVMILIVILFLFSSFAVYSETIEEQLLKQKEVKIKTWVYQAKVGDRNIKSDVLDKIISDYDQLKFTNKDKELVELVVFLSEEGTSRKEYEDNRVANDFPEVRRKAVLVLAKLGGDQAREAIINILTNDPNSTVKAEACDALSQVKDNSSGEVLRALIYVYRSSYKPDPKFVYSIINALKAIANSNSVLYSEAIYILSEIQLGNYNEKIRKSAYDAITELSNGKKSN